MSPEPPPPEDPDTRAELDHLHRAVDALEERIDRLETTTEQEAA